MIAARRTAALAIAFAVAIGVARDARADRVSVKVVEVAGGLAYVAPGGKAGIRPGQTIKLGKVELRILEVTADTAVVALGTTRVDVGDRGVVEGVVRGGAAGDKLPAPRPPGMWTGQWPDAVVPATTQDPKRVPLGRARPRGRLHARVLGLAMFTPSSRQGGGGGEDEDEGEDELRLGGDGEAQARLIVSYDVLPGRVAGDLDLTARVFTSGFDSRSRTPVWVRAAQLRYGTAADPRIALGRIPWAATGVGVLDGARASVRLGALELAGFGGLVPDALNGRPDTGAARFGAEAIYDAPATPWQPRLALTAYGSTWDGTLDERRATASASVTRGGLALDGWAELQAFPAGNPWGAGAVELTGAGAGGEYRKRGVHAGLDVALLRPERSLRLASLLPEDWLCARTPLPGDVAEDCAGGDLWTWATASAGVARSRVVLDAGGSVGTTHGGRRRVDASAFGRAELRGLPRRGRVFGGASYGRAGFLDFLGAELGAGASPVPALDVTVAYRPELLSYRASVANFWIHSVTLDGRWAYSPELDLGAAAVLTTGLDRDALTLLATVAWRPLP
jgi:hypothetical protein